MKELEKLKVGDYVRTNNGIFIISHINIDFDDSDYKKVCLCQNKKVAFTSIYYLNNLKHSPNIIDLIEVGDYVNGMEIDEFDDVEGNLYLGFPIYDDGLMDCISEFRPLSTVEIKSIVTKEQFKNMEYRLEK